MWQMATAPVAGRRLRPLLPHGAREDRICDQPLCHGSQAHSRRRRPAPGGQPLFLRASNTPSPTSPTSAGSTTSSRGDAYGGSKFLDTASYRNLARWVGEVGAARRACGAGWWSIAAAARGTLPERHSGGGYRRGDGDLNRQDTRRPSAWCQLSRSTLKSAHPEPVEPKATVGQRCSN